MYSEKMLAHSFKRIFIYKGSIVPQLHKIPPRHIFYNSVWGKVLLKWREKTMHVFK